MTCHSGTPSVKIPAFPALILTVVIIGVIGSLFFPSLFVPGNKQGGAIKSKLFH
jgi:hypothetical protein